NITDDRNGALLNSARELFGHTSLGFTLTNGGVHGTLLRRSCPRSRPRRSFITPGRGEQQDSPHADITPSSTPNHQGQKRSFVMACLTRCPTSSPGCAPKRTLAIRKFLMGSRPSSAAHSGH